VLPPAARSTMSTVHAEMWSSTALPAAFANPMAAAPATKPLLSFGTVASFQGTAPLATQVSTSQPNMQAAAVGFVPATMGLGVLLHLSEGAAVYAQHQEYKRYIATLQFQLAAASSASEANPTQLQGSTWSQANSGSGGFRNHDPERRYQGIVCRWDELAGFGFINNLESHRVYGRDVFLHAAQIDREADNYKRRRKIDITNGDTVAFMVEMDRGKPRARDVEIISKCVNRDDPDVASEPDTRRRRM